MQLPIYSKKNYAIHLLGSSLVELFPKLQLLDYQIALDKVYIDFSFSRALSSKELELVEQRFLEKISQRDLGAVREMVSSNACDLLKYHKQFFLTALVDKEESFTEMFCMDLYNAPIEGEIDQGKSGISEVSLDFMDLGERKWMKRKIHHYRLNAYLFKNKALRKLFFTKQKEMKALDHVSIGKKGGLYFIKDGRRFFSSKGQDLFNKTLESIYDFFGRPSLFDGDCSDCFEVLGVSEILTLTEDYSNFFSDDYGLKATEIESKIIIYAKEKKDFIKRLVQYLKTIGLTGVFYDDLECIVYDYIGRPIVCGRVDQHNDYFTLEISMGKIFALYLENNAE